MKKLLLIFNKLQWLLTGSNSRDGQTMVCHHEQRIRESASTPVSPERIATLVDEIVSLLEEHQIYKSRQIDLKSLSQRLNTPAYLVTKAINDGLGVNFYDLINRYRVEEVKSLLKTDHCKRFTLLSIAFDAGFSSKTTFNTVFKKMTGLTPSSYREQCCDGVEVRQTNETPANTNRIKVTRAGVFV